MKIKIKDIIIPWYAPREKVDDEYINDLMRSLKESGQWSPVMVRLNENKEYELIAGLQRITAAKRIGWDEIEAHIVDSTVEKAALLAIETNLVRKDLQEIEEGHAIKEMMDRLELNQTEIAKKLGRSRRWVGDRLSLALDIVGPVRKMIADNLLSPSQAVLISRLPPNKQSKFAEIIINKQETLQKKLSQEEIRAELQKFGNDTIFTIGYEGKKIDPFISDLKRNKIDVLLDVRESTKSMQKPEFSEEFLRKNLNTAEIKYLTRKDLGAPYVIRESYIKGGLSQKCFEKWYKWNVSEREGNKIPDLIEMIKSQGKTALMCYEKDVNTCHRNILADLIMETGLFEKRRDL